MPVGGNACKPNPALQGLAFLIGDWTTVGRHPAMPGEELHGRTNFSWHEGGAFILMRSEVNHPDFPDGIAIIGSNEAAGTFFMIYFDERAVSRTMDVTVGDRCMTWRRDDPDFAQMLTITAEGNDKMVGKGSMAKGGEPWTDDLSQDFVRVGAC